MCACVKIDLRRILAALAGCAACVFLAACSTVDAVTRQPVRNMYTVQEDISMGRSAMSANLEELRKQGVKINADPAQTARLNVMVRKIAAVSDMPNLPYEVSLAHTGIVNAAAMPGGQLIVFEGLYATNKGLVKDDDEMAAVLAHEIAHVNCRHSTERLTVVMPAALLAEVGAIVLESNDQSDWAQAVRAAFVVGSALAIPMYSRKDEYEADRVGMFYMAKAGYDPRAAPRIWKRVADKGSDGNAISIFATHPGSGDRYQALNKLLPYAMDEYQKSKGSYPKDYIPPISDRPAQFDWRALK